MHLGVEASFRSATKAHPAFIVDDVRAMAAAVVAAGFAVNDGEPLDGFDRVYVSDPFGNRIELMQPNEEGRSGVSSRSNDPTVRGLSLP